jgi:hypothetical protein
VSVSVVLVVILVFAGVAAALLAGYTWFFKASLR